MATEWDKGGVIITTSLAIGKALAAKLDPDTGGLKAFDPNGWKLRPLGSSDVTPSAWAVRTRLRQRGYDAIVEFNGVGPYTVLNTIGITNEDITLGKTALTIEVGDAEYIWSNYEAILASHGYERIPE